MRLFEVAGFVVGGYLLLLGGLAIAQRSFIFPRETARPDVSRAGIPGLTEIRVRTSDGETLVAWHRPPQRPDAGVIVYFHGNAGNLARGARLDRLKILAAEGHGLLAIHYRGYGGSTGEPSEAGLHLDADAAHAEAVRRYPGQAIILYGESLGTGVAVRLATRVAAQAVVLEAPYTSLVDVVQRFTPLIPVGLLLSDPMPTIERIGAIRAPLLVLHGDADAVIPFEQGERVFAAAPEPKRFVRLVGGGHEDSHQRGGTAVMRAFLADIRAGRLTGAASVTIGR